MSVAVPRARVQEIAHLFVVNLDVRGVQLVRPALLGVRLGRFDNLGDGARNHAAVLGVRALLAEHGVRLARARLAVREQAHLVPVQRALHELRNLLEDLLLLRLEAEHLVEGEHGGVAETIRHGDGVAVHGANRRRRGVRRGGADGARAERRPGAREDAHVAAQFLDLVVHGAAKLVSLHELALQRRALGANRSHRARLRLDACLLLGERGSRQLNLALRLDNLRGARLLGGAVRRRHGVNLRLHLLHRHLGRARLELGGVRARLRSGGGGVRASLRRRRKIFCVGRKRRLFRRGKLQARDASCAKSLRHRRDPKETRICTHDRCPRARPGVPCAPRHHRVRHADSRGLHQSLVSGGSQHGDVRVGLRQATAQRRHLRVVVSVARVFTVFTVFTVFDGVTGNRASPFPQLRHLRLHRGDARGELKHDARVVAAPGLLQRLVVAAHRRVAPSRVRVLRDELRGEAHALGRRELATKLTGRLLHRAHLRRDVARRGGAGERAAALLQLGAALLQLILERDHAILELNLLRGRVIVRASRLLAVQTRVLALSLALHLGGARASLRLGGARLGVVRASLRDAPSL
mmetsp:Transcript_8760/g.36704  ORF Transcript_8760/g.36704 Transcript_8760/m.36704 type:complete len:581 (+) Transcript_8760:948-2690(+)